MAETASKMVDLGSKAPHFSLFNPCKNIFQDLDELKGEKGTVIMFICNHCPYVKNINKALVALVNKYLETGIKFIAINPNDAEKYPDDSPENMVAIAKNLGYRFPYLYDETQETAKAYGAACTPDIFVYDQDMSLVYRGQFDDSRPNNDTYATGDTLDDVLQLILQDKSISPTQIPSVGCGIKWKD